MFEFLSRFFSGGKSKEVAKERLQLVLIHDRNDIAPEKLEALKVDMVKLLKKYLHQKAKAILVHFSEKFQGSSDLVDKPGIKIYYNEALTLR